MARVDLAARMMDREPAGLLLDAHEALEEDLRVLDGARRVLARLDESDRLALSAALQVMSRLGGGLSFEEAWGMVRLSLAAARRAPMVGSE